MYKELTFSPSKPERTLHTLPMLLGLSLSALSGCTSADSVPTAEQWTRCEPSTVHISDLPDRVLMGTDSADAASFEDSDASLAGQYQVETGGATIGAMVNPETVFRQFEEPGTEPSQRTFQPVCIQGSYLFAEGLIARRVAEGLLWLERESDAKGIPSDKWLLLEPL